MPARTAPVRIQTLRRAALAVLAAVMALALRRTVARVSMIVLAATALSFMTLPLARRYEARLSRPIAALAALLTLAAAALGVLGLSLPTLAREIAALTETLPVALDALNDWLAQTTVQAARRFPGLPRLSLDAGALIPPMPDLAANTLEAASSIAGGAGRLSIAVILSYFFLRDRDSLALRLELLLPAGIRPTGIAMALAAGRELRLYLWAQLRIALTVGALTAGLLLLLRVRSAAVLGLFVGLMNVIPYFGPMIGGAPALLAALADGPRKAGLALLALCLVQQLDGAMISPRIMGGVTGLSPAAVLLALFAGAELCGVPGMLFAIPLLIIIRTLFRVYVQRAENI